MTRRGNDMRLYLDGGLQFSTRDEYRYTESLVYPALGGGAHSVLVLGGGDGLAARELLRQPGVGAVVQVELDSAVVELARTTTAGDQWRFAGQPAGEPRDRRRDELAAEEPPPRAAGLPGAHSTRSSSTFPTPTHPVLGRLYSTEFYALAAPCAGPRRADGGAGGQPVFHGDGVLAHGLDDPGRRVCGHAVSRARADVR